MRAIALHASVLSFLAALTGLAACSEEELAGSAAPVPVVFQEIGSGNDTALADKPQFRLIENQTELDELYSLQSQMPPLVPPAVDFDHEVVYFATTGPRPTTGHGIRIERLQRVRIGEGIEGLEILVEAGRPGPGCMVGQAFMSPYVLISFPRQDLASGVINVDLRDEVYRCDG